MAGWQSMKHSTALLKFSHSQSERSIPTRHYCPTWAIKIHPPDSDPTLVWAATCSHYQLPISKNNSRLIPVGLLWACSVLVEASKRIMKYTRMIFSLSIPVRLILKSHDSSKSIKYLASCALGIPVLNWSYPQLQIDESFDPERLNLTRLTLYAPTWWYGYFCSCFLFVQANCPYW